MGPALEWVFIDALSLIAATVEQAPRPYRLVISSDHGQTDGDPFELRYGETLTEVVRDLMSAELGGDADGDPPDLIVAASGNLAHIYFPGDGRRSSVEEIEALHPALMAGLISPPGVGVVVVQAGDAGLVALGPNGSLELETGRVEDTDPLEHYGPLAAESILNIAASRNAGDLVAVSMYDPVADEVASFEPQIGSHGGIGGPQTQAILVYPAELELTADPLALEGVDAVRAKIREWLDVSPSADSSATLTSGIAPPPTAHIGEQVCLTIFYDPTDSVRKRADEQLAEDAIALGRSRLAVGLAAALQQFGGPVFFGTEPTVTWSVPSFFDP